MDTEGHTSDPEPSYAFTARLPGTSFAEAKEHMVAALQEEGFGILSEIDVQATLKKKLGVAYRPYLLPCNVCIWAEGDTSVVSIADPEAMFRIVGNPRLKPVADEARRRLGQALEKVRHRGLPQ